MPTDRIRAVILAGVAAAALLAAAPAAEAQTAPANAREQAAFDVRFLQTEFMVAALSCGRPDYQSFYNSFVARFGAPLKRHADVLKAHFTREYGKQGLNRLDSFATKLANEASLRSMQQVTFCQDTGLVMERVAALDAASLEGFSASFARSVETLAATASKTR
ncbi:MAG: hypothetical protein ACK4NA_16640 [Alphaproteobacteria bacterium]